MTQGCSFCTFDDGYLMTSFDIAYALSKEYGVPEDYIDFRYCPECSRRLK